MSSLCRLAKFEHEVVGFADRLVLCFVLVAEPESWRKSPHALRPVRRILEVGVDLGGAREHETGPLGERDGVVLPDVAVYGLWILRCVPLAAVVLKTEHAARFQRAIEGREGFISEAFFQPIVKIAKGKDEIGRGGRSKFALSNAKDGGGKLAIRRLVSLNLGAEEHVQLVCFSVRSLASPFPLQCNIIDAVIVQKGREDLRPVAAAGPDLDHGRLRRNAKEGEFIERMTDLVARDEFRTSRRIVDCGVERQISGGNWRADSERKNEGGREDRRSPMGPHRLVYTDVSGCFFVCL